MLVLAWLATKCRRPSACSSQVWRPQQRCDCQLERKERESNPQGICTSLGFQPSAVAHRLALPKDLSVMKKKECFDPGGTKKPPPAEANEGLELQHLLLFTPR